MRCDCAWTRRSVNWNSGTEIRRFDGPDRNREFDGERCAGAFSLAVRRHQATVQFDDVPDNRQANAETGVFTRRRPIFLSEPIEDVGQELG